MNFVDYLFEKSGSSPADLILGPAEKVSYAQIYNRSMVLARWIATEYGRDQNILLISPNSSFFICAYLAIMKSGNICVPIDPQIEKSTLDYISGTTGARIAFVPLNLRKRVLLDLPHIIGEHELEEIEIKELVVPAEQEVFPESKIAQIIFTSGSTGLPKGVMLSHMNLRSNTESILQYLKLTSRDIIEVVLPFYYCYGLSLLHTHMRVGGSVVLNNSFAFLGSVFRDLEKYKCTGFSGVPSHFQILLRKSKSFKTAEFPHLRYITQAGGKLHKVLIKEFVDTFPEKDFYVMYGQTEATARLSYLEPAEVLDKLGSIGKAIPGVQLEVFDENSKPVPAGKVGEIVAFGGNIMEGYFNDLEETSQTLKDGWLYTGDLAKKDKDGYLYLVARKKEILKVRGKRISPKEIEEVILSVDGIVDCTISGIEDEILGEAISARIVIPDLKKKEEIREEIISICSKNLAVHKIPQVFEFMDKMEIAQTGKKIKGTNS